MVSSEAEMNIALEETGEEQAQASSTFGFAILVVVRLAACQSVCLIHSATKGVQLKMFHLLICMFVDIR